MPPPGSTSTSSAPRRRLRKPIEALVALWLLLLWAGLVASIAMPPSSWLGPLEAQRAGQMSLVAVRIVALGGALVALRARPRRERLVLSGVLGLALLASVRWNVGALALAALASASFVRARVAFHPRALPTHCAAALVGAVGAFWMSRPAPPPPAATLASETMRWIERDNPHRALPLARAWAADEPAPAEGALALAEVARRLGDEGEARAIATSVLRAGPPASQERARAFLGGSGPVRGRHTAPSAERAP